MKNKKIFIKQWLELKPYEKHSSTDNYYLKICNKVNRILSTEYFVLMSRYIDTYGTQLLSCILVSYFEDIISETNIFTAFVNKHQKLYNKKLPFYDTSNYIENEINEQDIQFLIWYILNTIQSENFINPNHAIFKNIASDIMLILEEEYEYAPENELLQKQYKILTTETDFYIARNCIDTVLFKTYLFYTDTYFELYDDEIEIIKNTENKEQLLGYLQDNRDKTIHNAHTRILSLTGKEWFAEILGSKHKLSNEFLKISKKISGYFFYKGQDEKNIFIEHIASNKKFNLTKESFDNSHLLQEIDTIVFMGIVLWKNEWWFSGVFFIRDFDADLILDEKNSSDSRMAVNFLENKNQEISNTLKMQLNAFKEFSNDQQLVFLPESKVESYIKDYINYFNESLNLTKKQLKQAKKRSRQDGYFGNENEDILDYSDEFETALIFFNPKSGVEIAFEVNSAFPTKENIYFNEKYSKEHILRLIMAEEISTELVMYCIDNYKNRLKFFKTKDGKLLLNDIDFLLRFFKRGGYHSNSLITFVGKQN